MARASISDLAVAERVFLYGVTGSGKSAAAKRIAAALGLPLHLADEEMGWLPGWVERDVTVQRGLTEVLAAERRLAHRQLGPP